jgi:voltage-gated potassium channel
MTRHRTWEFLEATKEGDAAGRAFGIFILILIFLNVIAVVLQSEPSLDRRFSAQFYAFELFSVAVFSIEYSGRLWSCVENRRFAHPLLGRLRFVFTPLAIVDLVAIVPFFAGLTSVDLRFVRALRLVRLARIAKAGRYVTALRLFGKVFRAKREELILISGLVLMLLVMAASIMYFAENEAQPEKFSSIPASMWWAVATLTTVGYGDVYPITAVGKIAGALVAILGIGFFALPTAIIGSGFVEAIQESKRPKNCPHCGNPIS